MNISAQAGCLDRGAAEWGGLTGLVFPRTGKTAASLRPFLQVFGRLVVYRITEEEGGVAAGQDDGLEFCCPAPLGEARGDFERLVADLTGHAGEYYLGQISALSSRAGSERGSERVWELVSALRGGPGPAAGPDSERLQGARLVLKLAEILAREESALADGLAAVDLQEKELLSALKGDMKEVPGEGESVGASLAVGHKEMGAAGGAARLLGAWGVIHAAGSMTASLLVTDDPGAAELFFDRWQGVFGRPVREAARLNLSTTVDSAPPVPSLERRDLKVRLNRGLEELLSGGDIARESFQQVVKEWNAAVGPSPGLIIHRLEGGTVRGVFQEDRRGDAAESCLVAVLDRG